MTKEKEIEKRLIITHKNSCGKILGDNEAECGMDLGGNNDEFAQCYECRIKDFYDEGFKEGQNSQKEKDLEIIELYFDMCNGARRIPRKEELTSKINSQEVRDRENLPKYQSFVTLLT